MKKEHLIMIVVLSIGIITYLIYSNVYTGSNENPNEKYFNDLYMKFLDVQKSGDIEKWNSMQTEEILEEQKESREKSRVTLTSNILKKLEILNFTTLKISNLSISNDYANLTYKGYQNSISKDKDGKEIIDKLNIEHIVEFKKENNIWKIGKIKTIYN